VAKLHEIKQVDCADLHLSFDYVAREKCIIWGNVLINRWTEKKYV
jgi:hypothetical protein